MHEFLPRQCNSKGIISNFREVLFPLSDGDIAIQRYKAAMRETSCDSNKNSAVSADNDKAQKSKAIWLLAYSQKTKHLVYEEL